MRLDLVFTHKLKFSKTKSIRFFPMFQRCKIFLSNAVVWKTVKFFRSQKLTFVMSSKSTPLDQGSHSQRVRPSIAKPWHVWYLLKAERTSYHIPLWMKQHSFPRGREDPVFIPNPTHPQSSLENSEFRRHFWKHCNALLRRALARRENMHNDNLHKINEYIFFSQK